MRFASPFALSLLALLPILWLLSQRRQPMALPFPSTFMLGAFRPTLATRMRHTLPWLRSLALVLVVVALARPQWGVEATRIYREGIAIAMVVDTSSSMGALDLQIGARQANRLDVVKETFRGFVKGNGGKLPGREGDLISLVTFARYATALSPLTLDHDALISALEQVKITALPEEDGTAIGEGMVAGIEVLRRAAGASKVMIVLTDGANNAGDTDPLRAAQIAKALGLRVYTIGAGTQGSALLPVREGAEIVLRQVPVYIDEDTLTQIANQTGGQYFRATDGQALEAIYAQIDHLEKARNVAEHYQQYIEGYAPLLLVALALLMLEMVLVSTRLRTLP